jgi:hypothetical protein
MRRFWLLISLSLIVSMIPAPASSANKVGASCSSKGQIKKVSGYKYTCIKSGTKLVWSKSVKVAAKRAPTATKAPIPEAPLSLNNLQGRLDEIINSAWLQATKKIASSATTLGTTQILVGPNTTEDNANSLESLNLASRLFEGFPQVKKLYLIKFSSKDIDWAQKEYEQLSPNNYEPNAVRNQCASGNGCVGAMAGINSAGDGMILMGQGGSYVGAPTIKGLTRAQNGLIIAHEYFHTIQAINASCRGGRGCYGEAPQWLLEGGATWSAAAARYSDNYDDFLLERNITLNSHYSNATSIYTSDYINQYLNPNPIFLPNQDNWKHWSKYNPREAYVLGFMASEIFVSIKGTASLMKLYADIGAGKSFVDAFQGIFGLSWAEACPIISEAIATGLKQGIKK